MENFSLSNGELIWLNQHGGRSIDDVIVDEEGKKYVLMGSGKKGVDVRVDINE